MAFHVWKKALGCTTFQPHWKAFFNPKAPLLAQKNDALRLVHFCGRGHICLMPKHSIHSAGALERLGAMQKSFAETPARCHNFLIAGVVTIEMESRLAQHDVKGV